MRDHNDTEAEGFRAIGKFVVEFSQLEFTIRWALAGLLKLSEEQFDPVTSAYDFAKLCTVSEIIFAQQYPTKKAEISKFFKECKELNDDRVKVVHGLWNPCGLGLRRVSNKMKVDWFYEKVDILYNLANRADALMQRVLFLGADTLSSEQL